ncbi:type I-F CRISPR-associated protein Csy3 [Testudinibacter aquarius]|uniref:CRISPR-associated Csy3 family protein n=1 Tax=Testudinibacter aquarius TaxID=1524974 RepID=A0A4R3YAC6_9PAST|nr:type I-F CRISPR-associated protein Csy3 [Testudinibacter aquarius]KAE9530175.1 CRISPR-associated protein Csy3 [Testudinibacter aquarius]TCV87958.1 CRISPR-associated Csy3 family protein [Testudinibacter aquarius]TNG90236.1 type I-F CRISPR-associated protein Csy3 [Testudinibacter aquarius]
MSKLTVATVLAFERNLDISDAVFWQIDSNNPNSKQTDVKVKEKSVRGTISNRLKNALVNDPEKLDAEVEKANLQKVDSAALDPENDTLIVKWTCKVLPFNGRPSVCNDQDYQKALVDTVESYIAEQGFAVLAQRYANNILNGRWLWRNRVGAEKIELTIKCGEQSVSIDNALAYKLDTFENDQPIQTVAKWIEQGLSGAAFILLKIEAKVSVGYGQEVYPSQELVLDTGNKKSKVLYQISDKAGMHSQKISNAIRTIDNWYLDAKFPIAIEPYGAVTSMGKAFRQPKQKQDFYTLFDNWVLKGKKPMLEQQHYVIGVLIRGGVFGASGKE